MSESSKVHQQRHQRALTRAIGLVTSLRMEGLVFDQNPFEALLGEVRGPDARAHVGVLAKLLYEALDACDDDARLQLNKWWTAVVEDSCMPEDHL